MPAYVIGQLDIHDPEAYQAYLNGFMPIFQRHGGELLGSGLIKLDPQPDRCQFDHR